MKSVKVDLISDLIDLCFLARLDSLCNIPQLPTYDKHKQERGRKSASLLCNVDSVGPAEKVSENLQMLTIALNSDKEDLVFPCVEDATDYLRGCHHFPCNLSKDC